MARGGRRSGAPGARYNNRSDMQFGPRQLPATAAPGQTYGDAKQQLDAQRAVPMATGPALPTPSPAQSADPGGLTSPVQVTPLHAPTQNPDEHVLAGAPLGPGPGPEALAVNTQPDEDLARLGTYLPVLELAASQPNSSAALRQFVRTIRGNLPVT